MAENRSARCLSNSIPRSSSGAITLEACISVTAFMLVMIVLASVFVFFRAQHETAHALLEATQSLSVDAYAADQIGTGGAENLGKVVVGAATYLTDKLGAEKHPQYATNEDTWLPGKKGYTADNVKNVLRKRFLGYIREDESEADRVLREMHVANGKDGLDFSDSYISDGVLYVTLKYTFEEKFMILGSDPPEIVQTARASLWL